jgi:predicted benzoate:H+ symporter BenE
VANKTEIKNITEMLQKMQDVDALGMLIIGSAGAAGLCGIKGPLTTLMMGIGSVGNDTVTGVSKMIANPIDTWPEWAFTAVAGPIGLILGPLFSPSNTSAATSNPTPDEAKRYLMMVGNAAGNMVEAGLLYTLVRNPDTMRTLFDMSKEAVKGVAGLAKVGSIAGGL